MFIIRLTKNNRGAVALITTIILSAVIAIVGMSIVFLNISSRLNVFNLTQSEQVFVKTEGCAEEALVRLSRDNSYTGGSYSVDGVDCTVNVNSTDEERRLFINGTDNNFTYDFMIDVTLSPVFAIISWRE